MAQRVDVTGNSEANQKSLYCAAFAGYVDSYTIFKVHLTLIAPSNA